MLVASFIDTQFKQVCIFEEISEVSEWLKEVSYLVVVNDHNNVEGIITLRDVHLHPYGEIADCNIQKPILNSSQTIATAIDIMIHSNCDYLPVTDAGLFKGVLSIRTLARKMIDLQG
ncbi:MAG: CBS domain-containing protein [Bacteroidota bacterium]